MPVSFADFHAQERTIVIKSSFGPVKWTYMPYRLTLTREAEIARIMAELRQAEDQKETDKIERAKELLVTQFCELIAGTDMVGPMHTKIDPVTRLGVGEPIVAAGETVPVRPETVRHFSSRYITEILEAVAADARPKEATPTS